MISNNSSSKIHEAEGQPSTGQVLQAMLGHLAQAIGGLADRGPVSLDLRAGDVRVQLSSGTGRQLVSRAGLADPYHNADYSIVHYAGAQYMFRSQIQQKIVQLLWEAREEGVHVVPQESLLRTAGSDSPRLLDAFKNHPSWRALIIHLGGGKYRLAPHPSDPDSCLDTPQAGQGKGEACRPTTPPYRFNEDLEDDEDDEDEEGTGSGGRLSKEELAARIAATRAEKARAQPRHGLD